MRLRELLLGASLLVGATGCPCPDGHAEDAATIARAQFKSQIDACLADDRACLALCAAVFGLDMHDQVEKCVLASIDEKSAVVEAKWYEPVECVGGRRPNGFVEQRCVSRAAGAWLARVATIEAASITAFARLVRALEHHGAPARFIAEAKRAVVDEVVHAKLVGDLARRMGASVRSPVIAQQDGVPSIEELARENAIEGQVAELFGALLATCQAQLATDPAVRGVFALIARDETRHAQLAQQLAPWFASRLDAPTNAAIEAARQAAITGIVDSFDVHVAAAERTLLGIPEAERLRTAAAALFVTM